MILDGLKTRIEKNHRAQSPLKSFMHAALRVRSHENIFNRRARAQDGLKSHLRDPEHMIALRHMRAAGDTLSQTGGTDARVLMKIVKSKIIPHLQ
jgi:hypothetical protein